MHERDSPSNAALFYGRTNVIKNLHSLTTFGGKNFITWVILYIIYRFFSINSLDFSFKRQDTCGNSYIIKLFNYLNENYLKNSLKK